MSTSFGTFGASFGSFGSGVGGGLQPAAGSEILQQLTGLEDDALTLIDRKDVVNPEPIVQDVNVAALNGTDATIDTGLTCADATCPIDMTIGVVFNSLDNGDGVVGQGTFGGSFGITITTGLAVQAQFRPVDGALNITSTFVPVVDTPYLFRMTWDGVSELKLYADGVEIASDSGARSGAFDVANILIGNGIGGGATKLDGDVFYWKSTTEQECQFAEGDGQPYDISGNGNRPTFVNTVWGTSDLAPSSNHRDGCSFYADDSVLLPYIDSQGSAFNTAEGGGSYFDSSDDLFFADRTGLHKSTDFGETSSSVDAVASLQTLQPRMVFVASNGNIFWSPWATGELRRSTDGGTVFADVLTIGTSNTDIGIWGFDEAPNGDLYAAVYSLLGSDEASVWRSQNDGTSWTRVVAANTDRHAHNVKVDPSNGYVYVTTGDTNQLTLRSIDGGDSFETIFSSGGLQFITIEFFNGMRIFGDDQSNSGKIYTTSDDLTLTVRYDSNTTTPAEETTVFSSWQYGGRVYQGMLGHFADSTGRIISSSDGITWVIESNGEKEAAFSGINFASRPSSSGMVCGANPSDADEKFLVLDLNTGLTQPAAGSYGTNLIVNSFMTAETAIKPNDWIVQTSDVTDGANKVSNQQSDLALPAIEWNISIDTGDGTSSGELGYIRLRHSNIVASQNDTFTLSAFVKGEAFSCGLVFTITEQDGVSSTLKTHRLRVPFIESDDFIRYHRTFTVEDVATTKVWISVGVFSVDPSTTCNLTIACPQLEDGSSMTDYRTKSSGEGFNAFYAPVLPDGSADVFGNTILNQGGYVHNGSEVTIVQTDADETIFGGVNFYTADEITWDKKTKAQLDTQFDENGELNLWIKKIGDSVKEAVQYPLTKVFTLAEAEKNLRYFGAGSDPMRDVDGDLILDVNGYIIYTA